MSRSVTLEAEILSALLMTSVQSADDIARMVSIGDWQSLLRHVDLRIRRYQDTRQRIDALRQSVSERTDET